MSELLCYYSEVSFKLIVKRRKEKGGQEIMRKFNVMGFGSILRQIPEDSWTWFWKKYHLFSITSAINILVHFFRHIFRIMVHLTPTMVSVARVLHVFIIEKLNGVIHLKIGWKLVIIKIEHCCLVRTEVQRKRRKRRFSLRFSFRFHFRSRILKPSFLSFQISVIKPPF